MSVRSSKLAWGLMVVLSGAVLLDQTTNLLNPVEKLDVSAFEKLEVGSAAEPVLDVSGLREIDPDRDGEKPDLSAYCTPIIYGENDVEINSNPTARSVPIAAGIIASNPSLRYVAPLTIETSRGADYFVKLVDRRTGSIAMSLYITGGQPMTVSAPLGTFRIRYASGPQWFGERQLFGRETATAEADADFSFIETANGYSGYTVELIRQQGGNLGTKSLPRDAF